MKCQNCGRDTVNFHYTSNINGYVTERHLCSECARELGYAKQAMSPARMLDSFFGSSFAKPVDFPGALGFVTPMLFAMPQQVGIILENPAGNPAIPQQDANVDDDMKKRREINILREQMQKAAENEDYEKAMELRDKLREME